MADEPRQRQRTVIGWRTATVLYLVLFGFAFATLKGKALILGLIIVGGIAAKSYLHYWKETISKQDDD
jgi:hypothetical protein